MSCYKQCREENTNLRRIALGRADSPPSSPPAAKEDKSGRCRHDQAEKEKLIRTSVEPNDQWNAFGRTIGRMRQKIASYRVQSRDPAEEEVRIAREEKEKEKGKNAIAEEVTWEKSQLISRLQPQAQKRASQLNRTGRVLNVSQNQSCSGTQRGKSTTTACGRGRLCPNCLSLLSRGLSTRDCSHHPRKK